MKESYLIFSQNDFVDEDDFLRAALENKLPMIKSYLARGADPNACDNVSVEPKSITFINRISRMIKIRNFVLCSLTGQLYTELAHKAMLRL